MKRHCFLLIFCRFGNDKLSPGFDVKNFRGCKLWWFWIGGKDQSFSLVKTIRSNSSMGVSKNRGTPKWMVYNGKPYQNGWFGGTTIFGNTRISCNIVRWLLATPIGMPCHIPGSNTFGPRIPSRRWRECSQLAIVLNPMLWLLKQISVASAHLLCTMFEKLNRPSRSQRHLIVSPPQALPKQISHNIPICYAFLENKLCHMTSVTSTKKIVATATPQRLDPSKNPILWSPGFSSQGTLSIALSTWKKIRTFIPINDPFKTNRRTSCKNLS